MEIPEKYLTGLRYQFKGVKGVRYRFMLDNMPEQVIELDEAGELEPYLNQVKRDFVRRMAELTPGCLESCGATQELQERDMAAYLAAVDQADLMVQEIARREVIEAP